MALVSDCGHDHLKIRESLHLLNIVFFLCVFDHLPCKFGELFSSLNWWQYVSVYDWQQQSHTVAVG